MNKYNMELKSRGTENWSDKLSKVGLVDMLFIRNWGIYEIE